jgi:hypothetical protein
MKSDAKPHGCNHCCTTSTLNFWLPGPWLACCEANSIETLPQSRSPSVGALNTLPHQQHSINSCMLCSQRALAIDIRKSVMEWLVARRRNDNACRLFCMTTGTLNILDSTSSSASASRQYMIIASAAQVVHKGGPTHHSLLSHQKQKEV